jgi:pyruvate dehydrogenase complex dehydrogenase (E1) component
MILVRTVFQAKFGKANELVASLKEAGQQFDEPVQQRILTDLSGPFDTVVLEIEAESLADWERRRAELFASPQFGALSARMNALIESGRNEYYTIET